MAFSSSSAGGGGTVLSRGAATGFFLTGVDGADWLSGAAAAAAAGSAERAATKVERDDEDDDGLTAGLKPPEDAWAPSPVAAAAAAPDVLSVTSLLECSRWRCFLSLPSLSLLSLSLCLCFFSLPSLSSLLEELDVVPRRFLSLGGSSADKADVGINDDIAQLRTQASVSANRTPASCCYSPTTMYLEREETHEETKSERSTQSNEDQVDRARSNELTVDNTTQQQPDCRTPNRTRERAREGRRSTQEAHSLVRRLKYMEKQSGDRSYVRLWRAQSDATATRLSHSLSKRTHTERSERAAAVCTRERGETKRTTTQPHKRTPSTVALRLSGASLIVVQVALTLSLLYQWMRMARFDRCRSEILWTMRGWYLDGHPLFHCLTPWNPYQTLIHVV